MLLALFEQHDRDAVLDRVAEAIAPVDEPLLAVGVGHQLERPLIAGVGQNLQQFRADAAPLAAAQSALRRAGRAEVEDAVLAILANGTVDDHGESYQRRD